MKLIPVITFYAGDHVEEYINLDHICSIAPYFDYDEFDVLLSDSLTVLSFVNGSNIVVISSYDDFMERLINIAKNSCNMNVMEED